MSHVVEVDQSGRIEFTKEDTVLAFANGMKYSILIPATVKRDCVLTLRRLGFAGPNFYLQLFAVGLFLLLKDHIGNISHAILDYEFLGREPEIKRYLSNYLRRAGHTITADQIQFLHIGKHSQAHLLAIATLRRQEKPNRVITLKEMLGEFRK
jgi:hypothetical protein